MKSRVREDKRAADKGTPTPDTNVRMAQYAMHALFSRLQATSPDLFTVKGGTLFFMAGDEFRPTMDIDLSLGKDGTAERGFEAKAIDAFSKAFAHAADDGLWIDPESIRHTAIREGFVPGVRLAAEAWVGKTRVDMKFDVCHGDVVYPAPVSVEVKPYLPKHQAAVVMPVYTWQTVAAEKLHGMSEFGMDTTRLKDFYDLAVIARTRRIAGEDLAGAVAATFGNRGTKVPLPEDMKALSDAFVARNKTQFAGWVAKNCLQHRDLTLAEAVDTIRRFAGPAIRAAATDEPLDLAWEPAEGGWVEPTTVLEPDDLEDIAAPEDLLPPHPASTPALG